MNLKLFTIDNGEIRFSYFAGNLEEAIEMALNKSVCFFIEEELIKNHYSWNCAEIKKGFVSC